MIRKYINILLGKDESMRHVRNYMIGQIMNKGLGFIIMPITTALLVNEEYAVNGLFNQTVSIFVILLSLNLFKGVTRFYFDDKFETKQILSAQLVTMLLSFIPTTLVSILTVQAWAKLFNIPFSLLYLVLFQAICQSIINFYLAYLQSKKQSEKYAAINVMIAFVTTLGGAFLAFLLPQQRYLGFISINVIMRIVVSVVALWEMREYLNCKFNKEMIIEIMKYNLPLIPQMLSNIALNSADSLMISKMVNQSTAGIYMFGYNFGTIITIVSYSINQTFSVEFYSLMNERKYESIKHKVHGYMKFILFISTCLIFFNRDVVLLMAKPSYIAGIKLIPIVTYGYLFLHFYTTLSAYISYYKKTYYLALMTIITAIVNIVLNYYGILWFGYEAAAYTTLISYIFLAIICAFIETVILKIQTHGFFKMFVFLVLYMIFTFVALFLIDLMTINYFTVLLIKLVVVSLTTVVINKWQL